jgi:hypothetical protein
MRCRRVRCLVVGVVGWGGRLHTKTPPPATPRAVIVLAAIAVAVRMVAVTIAAAVATVVVIAVATAIVRSMVVRGAISKIGVMKRPMKRRWRLSLAIGLRPSARIPGV